MSISEVKVVIGASYGDEGKGMVAGCLGEKAAAENKRILSVLSNGCAQRGHTYKDEVYHCVGTANFWGGETFYDGTFVLDPITLWLTNTRVYIHPGCRVIFPWDVLVNRARETARGANRHGSCGMGLFQCVERSKTNPFYAAFLKDCWALYNASKIIKANYKKTYEFPEDELYNLDNFLMAADWVAENCKITTLAQLYDDFDVVIYENGQGLGLSQQNVGAFPYLTPSSTGIDNIVDDIKKLNVPTELYYVSRAYQTRHGAGPMDKECGKNFINPNIVDTTNQLNEWQGDLRFGLIDKETMYERILNDANKLDIDKNINIVYTQLNYTNNRIYTLAGREPIEKPDWAAKIYGSDKKDFITPIL